MTQRGARTDPMAVPPSATYSVDFWTKTDLGVTTQAVVEFYDSGDVLIATHTIPADTGTGDWQETSYSNTSPASTAYAIVDIGTQGAAAITAYLDGAHFTTSTSVIPIPTVTLSTPSTTISPDPVPIPIVIPAPALAFGAITVSPDPVAVPIVVPTPAVTTPYAAAPSPVAVPIVIPAPTVTLGALTISPAPVAVPIVVPGPTVTLGAISISPDPVAIPIVLPTPTVTAPANQTITPDPIQVLIGIPVPTVTSAVTPPVVVVTVGGGVRPTREPFVHPFPPLIPEPPIPAQVLRPLPVVVQLAVGVASVQIDWLSKIRYEDEELVLMGVL